MVRPPPTRADTRTFAQHEDARDLRAGIARVLEAPTIDARQLRNAVWTYARLERDIGVAPGVVIHALADVVGRATLAPDVARAEYTRRVILWCVEAYFGRLGDDALDAWAPAASAGGSALERHAGPTGATP